MKPNSSLHRGHQRKAALIGLALCLVVWALTMLFVFMPSAQGQYTNVGPSTRSEGPTVTNRVTTYWATNGAGGGNLNYSAGLSTNGMLVWTNIASGAGNSVTNFYLVYNDLTWRTNMGSTQWYHGNEWDLGTNFPDVGPTPLNAYATTSQWNNSTWWANTSSKPWAAASLTLTGTAWNTYTGWNYTNGPGAATNINYEH